MTIKDCQLCDSAPSIERVPDVGDSLRRLVAGIMKQSTFDHEGRLRTIYAALPYGWIKWAKDEGCDLFAHADEEPKTACPACDNLRRCVQWYADGNHYELSDTIGGDWESVSGEPDNWLCPPELALRPGEGELYQDYDAPWMVENGGVARTVLAGGQMNTDLSDEETIVHAAPASTPKEDKHG